MRRKIAVNSGSKLYFTGKPCKRGHVSPRRVDNRSCLDCLATNVNRTALIQKHYLAHRDDYKRRANEWSKANPEKRREITRRWRQSPEGKIRKYAETAARRATRQRATPPWVNTDHYDHMRAFYREAKVREQQTGIKHHVDHIIPLNGKFVCGLHVWWNLQILTETENLNKSNRVDNNDTRSY